MGSGARAGSGALTGSWADWVTLTGADGALEPAEASAGGCCAGTSWTTWGFGSGPGAEAGALTGGWAVCVALTGALELAGVVADGATGAGLGVAAGVTRTHSQPRFLI